MENNAQFNDPTMTTSAETFEPTSNEKAFAILAYFGILWLIGLIKDPEKDSPYVKNHVNNGIILCIAGVASSVICGLLSFIVIGAILAPIIGIALTVFAIIGIVKAAQNQTYKLPIVGDKFTLIK